jgi:hypothetical protein
MNDEGERIIEEERNMEDGLGKKQGKDHGRRRRVGGVERKKRKDQKKGKGSISEE